ncbi:putative eukaryotic translation initiation factor 3 subunit 8 [Leptomonas pyrrhocoris]|uniref:Putative eukaryotic translation initiation factor 3 subunit 8 n=1 Tax=Leptomonas pyrrhocoris TaxID=157538 RepID=A0A0N0DWK1_LEPPY|nr:putative eukaryotic translation initiation factor 3 subunit 8 [Leptomonas pyrrhocoris]XP_015660354.1 putative eukaryotic translation initiation factor 3 subunit 8 [Leptomonas pyrrhocoris]KPA81914.1 putative eukaryotic translation initiation factor 3 subunit 8 [Leptomonas pyrrhocoris]KPA81915.1 putative eukaryotic translation initiation factor 3 subunit 8 [Leptomonas pyrrhocoris]|eukprot:XP_015660353.1 putative eukaryotic translation initiation factor 3 subunit 8 [Leptomonas pyrrhocoris]
MNYFSISSADSDSESENSFPIEEVAEAQINPYWFELTDEEELEERHEVIPKKDKAANAIEALCKTFDYNAGNELWKEAYDAFKRMSEEVHSFVRKYKEAPQALQACLQDMPNLSEHLEGKSREDFANKVEYRSLKSLITLVEETENLYKKELKALEKGPEEEGEAAEGEEEGAKDLTEADYAKILEEISGSREVNLVSKVEKVIRDCGNKGYTNLEASATGIAVSAVLKRDSRKLLVGSDTWGRAFKWAVKFFQHILDNPSVRFVEDSSSVTARDIVVPGGLHGVLTFLRSELENKSKFEDVVSQEYLKIIAFENDLALLTDRVLGYYLSHNRKEPSKACIAILLATFGQRRQEAHDLFYASLPSSEKLTVILPSVFDTVRALRKLSIQLKPNLSLSVSSACHVAYQYGLCGLYREGRDYLLRTGVANHVTPAVAPLAILLNRAIAQLGLAAFIAGDIPTAHELLRGMWGLLSNEIQLGQKAPPKYQLDDEHSEMEYRNLMLPPHLYMPPAQLELAAVLSGLLDGAKMEAQNPYERKHMERYVYNTVTRTPVLMGKPFSFKEQVAVAYEHLKVGNYAGAKEQVEAMATFDTLPSGKQCRERFLLCMKEVALLVFCYRNRCNFSTMSVSNLSIKFDMNESEVRRAVNEILADPSSLSAWWDRDDAYLYLDRNNTTRLQHLVKGTAEGIFNLAKHCDSRIRQTAGRGRGGRGAAGGRGGAGGRGNVGGRGGAGGRGVTARGRDGR